MHVLLLLSTNTITELDPIVTTTSHLNFNYLPQKVSWTERDVLLFACYVGSSTKSQIQYPNPYLAI
jgi:hypothetical protein